MEEPDEKVLFDTPFCSTLQILAVRNQTRRFGSSMVAKVFSSLGSNASQIIYDALQRSNAQVEVSL